MKIITKNQEEEQQKKLIEKMIFFVVTETKGDINEKRIKELKIKAKDILAVDGVIFLNRK